MVGQFGQWCWKPRRYNVVGLRLMLSCIQTTFDDLEIRPLSIPLYFHTDHI